MRKLCPSLSVSVLLLVFGLSAPLLSQEVTPAPPEQQAEPRTPPPATPSDTNPAPSPMPTATATKVLAAAPVATPAPDLTVVASKPQKKTSAVSAAARRPVAEKPSPKEPAPTPSAAVATATTNDAAPPPAGPGGAPISADSSPLEPLPPPDASQAVTPSAEVTARTTGSLAVSLLLGGVLLAAAGPIVFRVIRKRRDQAVHLLDSSFRYGRTPLGRTALSPGRRI